MDNLKNKKEREPKVNIYYEVKKDKLLIHHFAINPIFRQEQYWDSIEQYTLCGIATGIWGDEKTPTWNWDESVKIPWRKTRPFEDLLDPNNKEAITEIDVNSMFWLKDERIARFLVIHPYHGWQFDSDEDARHFYKGSLLKLQEECLQDYIYGVPSQPVRVKRFIQGDIFIGGNDSDRYMVPTRPYINSKRKSEHPAGLIPGIIIIPNDSDVNVQLLNCGDYKRFLERTGTGYSDRTFAQSFNYSKITELGIDELSDEERARALVKAQEDKPVLKILRSNVHYKH